MNTIRRILIFFFFVFFLLISLGGYYCYTAIQYSNTEAQTLEVASGASLRRIAQDLQNQGVIYNARVFEYFVRFLGSRDGKPAALKSGEYEFKPGQDFFSVVDQMLDGKVKQYSFTIPEGYSLKQISSVLVGEKKLMTRAQFDEEISRRELLSHVRASLGVSAITTLEGFVFPDTYSYEKNSTPRQIITAMVDNFIQHLQNDFGPETSSTLKKRQMGILEWVTLASLVEKETGAVAERPLIAGVFISRLHKGMLLQTDPAVIYGIPNFNGNLTSADLKRDTPYNTYTRAGLPPGPICSVGLDALRSALMPAATDYLYFVAKGDGTHYFSKTLDEHNRAVRYYQLKQGTPPAPQ